MLMKLTCRVIDRVTGRLNVIFDEPDTGADELLEHRQRIVQNAIRAPELMVLPKDDVFARTRFTESRIKREYPVLHYLCATIDLPATDAQGSRTPPLTRTRKLAGRPRRRPRLMLSLLYERAARWWRKGSGAPRPALRRGSVYKSLWMGWYRPDRVIHLYSTSNISCIIRIYVTARRQCMHLYRHIELDSVAQ